MKKLKLKYIIICFIAMGLSKLLNAQTVSINTNTTNAIQVPSNFVGFSFDPAYYTQYFGTSYNSNNSRNITKQLFNNFYPYQKPDVRFLGNNGMYWKNGTYAIPTTWNYASTTPYNYVCTSCPTTSVATALSMTSGDDINTGDLDNYRGFLDLLNYKPTTLFGISLAFLEPDRAKDFSLTVKNKFTGYDYSFEIGNEPDAFVSNARRTSTYNATEFTNEFKLIRDALISANPLVNIAGPAYAKTNNTSGTSWSGQIGAFIDNIGSSLKVVTMHDYPLGLDPNDPTKLNNYLSKYLSNNYTNDAVSNLSSGLAPSINTSKGKNVPFRLAEANSIAGGGTLNASDAFGSALWAIDYMFELAKAGAAGIDIMTAGGTTTYYSPFTYSSTFVANGQKVRVNPIYYGMLFFANATQNNAKIMDITSQASISESINNFKVWATKDANNTLRVLVINRGTSITDVSSKTITLTLPGAKMPGKKYDLLATGGSVTGAIGKTVVSGASFTIGGQTISPIDGSLTGTATNTTITPVNETYTIILPAASASILEIPQNDCSVLTPTTPTISNSSFTYCQNETNTGSISATASNGNTLQWYTTATGGTATITTPTISTVNSGTSAFYVSQKESTLGCESNRAVITININPLPTLSAITGTLSATVSNTSTLSNSTPGGTWTSSDNTVATISSNGIVSALKAGSTTITYTYTNSNSCSSAVSVSFAVSSASNSITAPVISAATATTFCEGQNVVLSSNDATNIQWYKNGTAITGATSQTYTVTNSGSYKVVKTSGNNSVSSNEIIVLVNSLPTLAAITGNLSATVGSNSTLANSTTGGVWTTSDNSVATINTSGVVSALKTGTTTITYTYTNSNNCSNTVSTLYTVTTNTTIVAPIISAATTTTFCDGQNVVLSSNDAANIQWYKNGTAITGATSQTYSATTSGIYKVIKTSGNNTATSNEITVTVNTIPTTPTISRDQNNNLVSSFIGTNNWYKEGIIISNETNTSYKPTINGSYTVKAISNGCHSNLSTPYYYVVTDIIYLSAEEYINVGPNPFVNSISINYYVKSALPLNTKIYSFATGLPVFVKEAVNTNSSLNLTHLPSGSYLMEMMTKDSQKRYRFKIIKL
jgi:peroxiredoxin family protein